MRLSPGDVLTMTAAVESLHATYPGQFRTDVRTPVPEVWQHNPLIVPLEEDEGAEWIRMEYPSIHQSDGRLVSFLEGYTAYLGERVALPLRLTTNRPHLYLSEDETKWIDQLQHHFTNGRKVPFWLVNAGIKRDYTVKQWPVESFQEVIDLTRGRLQWVQIGDLSHDHPELRGVIDLRGKTDHRQLMRLAYHADGGLGPVTYLQHLCAAFQKPYICLLGGREPVGWVQYPLQHTLHTLGLLPCCRSRACWKSRVVPLNDGDGKNNSLCEWPVLGLQRPVAKCMAIIRPEQVVAILAHYARP